MAMTRSARWSRTIRPRGLPTSAVSVETTYGGQPRSSVPASGSCRRSCRALPVAPGNCSLPHGQQPAPPTRNAGEPRSWPAADEWPAHGPEQPRVRRERRPSRLPQLGESGARRATGSDLERRPDRHSALGAADPRDAPFRYVEQGSIRSCGSPPRIRLCRCRSLERIRRVLGGKVFLVVQDLYLTETARLADVVLPAAGWGEKTGTFTNAERTVHLSEQAVDPPRRGPQRPRDLPRLFGPHGFCRPGRRAAGCRGRNRKRGFDAWRECSRDALATTADCRTKLRATGGMQWPVTSRQSEAPHACTSMESSRPSPTTRRPSVMTFLTGATVGAQAYRAESPSGRAILKASQWSPPDEEPDTDYPPRCRPGAPSTTSTAGPRRLAPPA